MCFLVGKLCFMTVPKSKVARMVLRSLVGPLTLWDESERPEFVKLEAKPTTGSLDGLATLEVASPAGFEPALPA